MRWLTRSHVHVDRVACPWLIRRFIDSEAEFLFVAPAAALDLATRLEALSFDFPGATYGHEDGHSSFITLLEAYSLKDPALHPATTP